MEPHTGSYEWRSWTKTLRGGYGGVRTCNHWLYNLTVILLFWLDENLMMMIRTEFTPEPPRPRDGFKHGCMDCMIHIWHLHCPVFTVFLQMYTFWLWSMNAFEACTWKEKCGPTHQYTRSTHTVLTHS